MTQKTIQEMFNLTGKVAIVTGGAMGIGLGIVKRLTEAGASVVIADLDDSVGQTVSAELVQSGSKVIYVKTDVSSESDVVSLFATTKAQFGNVDILVNNAGIYPQKMVLDMDVEFWDKVQAVNGRGVFLCCKEAGKIMAAQKSGSIVNIGSIDSLHPSMVGLAAYDTSKHGVWGFTKNFALEMAPQNVRVNMVAPGGITTEGVAKSMGGNAQMEAAISSFVSRIPMGKMGTPDDIALATLFLSSEASSYMTGSMIVVDGGVLLK